MKYLLSSPADSAVLEELLCVTSGISFMSQKVVAASPVYFVRVIPVLLLLFWQSGIALHLFLNILELAFEGFVKFLKVAFPV